MTSGDFFQRLLWGTRYVVLVPVVGALLLAIAAFVLGAADTVSVIGLIANYLGDGTNGDLRSKLISSMVKAIDADLIGAILLVVGLGFYELFIGRLRVAEESDVAERVLTLHTLDDLKDRISRLVLLILIVEFFGIALGLSVATATDLLLFGSGIFLIAAAIYLASRRH